MRCTLLSVRDLWSQTTSSESLKAPEFIDPRDNPASPSPARIIPSSTSGVRARALGPGARRTAPRARLRGRLRGAGPLAMQVSAQPPPPPRSRALLLPAPRADPAACFCRPHGQVETPAHSRRVAAALSSPLLPAPLLSVRSSLPARPAAAPAARHRTAPAAAARSAARALRRAGADRKSVV